MTGGGWEEFVNDLRKAGMGAWRRSTDLRTGRVAEAGKRVPDRVVDPIPGVPDDGPHTVIAASQPKQKIMLARDDDGFCG